MLAGVVAVPSSIVVERRTGAFRSCKRIDCGFSVSPEKCFVEAAISSLRLGVLLAANPTPPPTPPSGTAASPPVAPAPPSPPMLLSMTPPPPMLAHLIRADGVKLARRDMVVPKLFSIS